MSASLDAKRKQCLTQLTRLGSVVKSLQIDQLNEEDLQTHLRSLEENEAKHASAIDALKNEEAPDFATIEESLELFRSKGSEIRQTLLAYLTRLDPTFVETSSSGESNDADQSNPSHSMTQCNVSREEKKLSFIDSQMRTYESLTRNGTNNLSQLKRCLVSIEKLFEDYSNFTSDLCTSDIDLTKQQQIYERQHNFSMRFMTLESEIQDQIIKASPIVPMKTRSDFPTTKTKLPTINLPKFDGSPDQWIIYRDSFKNLVHNNPELAPSSKFRYLKSTITDKHSPICHLIESDDGYDDAWKIVVEFYDDKRKIVDSHFSSMLTAKRMTSETHEEIQRLVTEFTTNTAALERLYLKEELYDAFIAHVLIDRLDIHTRDLYETEKSTEVPLWPDLRSFLEKRRKVLNSLPCSKSLKQDFSRNTSSVVNSTNTFKPAKSANSYIVNNSKVKCHMCYGDHLISKCTKFNNLSNSQRIIKVREWKICINCFGSHSVDQCTSKWTCRSCKLKHHSMLHQDQPEPQRSSFEQWNRTSRAPDSSQRVNTSTFCSQTDEIQQQREDIPIRSVHATFNSSSSKGTVLLSTAIVFLQDKWGEWHEARALLDSGSDANFITKRVADVLQLQLIPTLVEAHGFGEKSETINNSVEPILRSRDGLYINKLEFLVTKKITGLTPSSSMNIQKSDYPQNLTLADPSFNVPGRIDLLIGNEVFFELLLSNQMKLNLGPMMQETVFGWIFTGKIKNQSRIQTYKCNLVTKLDLNESIERFWKEDDYRNQKRFYTEEEEYCEQVFEQTHQRSSDGRFIVKIPLKENVDQLVDNRNQAICQFIANEKRLSKNERLKSESVKFMREYEELGHMEEIQSFPSNKTCYYLPHHAVEKPDSTTTKVRIVFNASAKTKSGVSFNDVQCVGPTIQSSTFSLMLKFRQHFIVIKADIAKMYRQIEVSQDQRHYQLIVWRENPSDKLKTYQLKTVTYGTSSASYQSTRCLKQLSIDNKVKFPKASEEIEKSFFVDDLVSGAQSLHEAVKLYEEIDHIIASGAMKLRKYISNSEDFISKVPIDDREKSENADNKFSILGIQWDSKNDIMGFDIKPIDFKTITKRAVLSEITKIYDPEGMLGPVIFKLKLFMKKIHLLNVNWDEKLTDDVADEWREIGTTFIELREIEIKRLITLNTYVTLQLHAFSDASEQGFGAAVYVRTEDSNGNRASKLFCAKSRVAPNARKSIVRLELCGGVIGANILSQVSEAMISKVNKKFLWLDSAIVLHWLKKCPSQLQTYVAGRVSEIQGLTKDANLRHVRGEENPSDLISRGLMPTEIINNAMWWHGPEFLCQPETTWPESIVAIDPEDVAYKVEFKKITSLVQQKSLGENPFLKWVNDSSQTFVLKKKLALILRFIHNVRARKKNQPKRIGNVKVEEIRDAELAYVRMNQKEFLNEEFSALSNGTSIASKSKIMNLCPFWDCNDRVIRVGGRLRNAQHIDEDQKNQMVLPKCHFARLIIRETHQKNMHAGQQATLGILRMKFYVLGAKNCVRMEIHRCIKCFRSRPKMIEQLMGQLPSPRVTPSHPFFNVGVDYAGPIMMKTSKIRNAKKVKAYIALFICLATKAVHLELVTDLTTEAFLASMDRFVSRRGLCKNIYSDHGTNFVGAKNKLQELQNFLKNSSIQSALQQKCIDQEITWHFIPPRAPEHGGLWEAGVKSMKYHLERAIGSASLTFEELSTVLCKIEAILNSRPLIPISDDPNDEEALTAGHFLIGRPLISMPQRSCADEPLNRLNRWDSILHIQQQFWKRWSRDYLHLLQARTKNYKHQVPVNVGQIVIMHIEDCSPMHWPLGKIVNIYPGTDELTRVASIQTSKGVYERRVNKLAILPIEDNHQILGARVC